ncbi:MAG: hypothetical protein KAV87_43400, partial [Desulfobacteraceae bacterium]|nr:hypothetical protein [Desulfobacteraceae bacterium]
TRGLGCFVGTNPIVFRTAPPHPALKASIIIALFAVGGPAASTKGLGKLILRNFVFSLSIIE